MKTIQQIREASGGKEAYQKFFNSILKKFGVDSPSELKGDKKKEFFDAIDKGWDGDNEKAESVSEASKLKGGRGKAEIDINWMGDKKDAKFAATKYKIKIKTTSNGAILSGDKQKILAYLQGKDYDMDAEDIEDLYPELMETYDDPDDYESEKDVTLNPDEDPLATGKSLGEANSALLKKAQAIASKLSGNMTKAVAEIEKLKKGLSDDKKVMAMLKTANEDISEAHVRAVDFEKTSKEIGKLKSGVDQSAIKQIAKYFNVMFKNSSLKIRDDAVLAVNKLKGKLSRDTRVEIDKILTTNNLMKNGNIMVEAAMKKNPAIDNNPEVKAARKAHAAGDWDGNVDKNGEAIVHIKGKPHTVTNNNESVSEAKKLSARAQFKTYVDKYDIKAYGMKNPDEAKKVIQFIFNAYKGRLTPEMMNDLVKDGSFFKNGIKANLATRNTNEWEAIHFSNGGWIQKTDYASIIKKNTGLKESVQESVSEAKKLKAGRGKATIDVNWTGGNDGVKDAFKKHKIKIKPTGNGAIITGDKKGILDFLSGTWYDMGTDDIEDLYPELMESIARVTLVNEANKYKAGKGKATIAIKYEKVWWEIIPVDYKNAHKKVIYQDTYISDMNKKYNITMITTRTAVRVSGNKANIIKYMQSDDYARDAEDIEDYHKADLMETVNEAIKVFAKKSGYVFYKDTVKDIAMLSYKGKVISSGDFDQGADGWFMELHQRGMEGQKFFSTGEDVIKFFMKNKITEAVSVDRRTMGFKEAMKRRAEAKAKREAMKIKAAKKQAKNDMASIDANYAYDGDIEEILASANKKIMGEDAPANASSSGAVDMNPTGKSKKKDKESLVARSVSLMAKRGY